MDELPPATERAPDPEQELPVETYEQFLDEYDEETRQRREATEFHMAEGASTEGLSRGYFPSEIQEREDTEQVARERLHNGNHGLVGRLISNRLSEEYKNKADIIAELERHNPPHPLSEYSQRYYAKWLEKIDSTVKRLAPMEQDAMKRYKQLRERYQREHE